MDWKKQFKKTFLDRPYEEGIIYADGSEVEQFIEKLLEEKEQEIENLKVAAEIDRVRPRKQTIVLEDIIPEEKKVAKHPELVVDPEFTAVQNRNQGFNQCIKDIKNNLNK